MTPLCRHADWTDGCFSCRWWYEDSESGANFRARNATPDNQPPASLRPPAGPARASVPPVAVPTSGPGTELMRLLAGLGIETNGVCDCKAKAARMDAWGVQGCRDNRDTIVGWLRDGQGRWGWADKLKAAARAVASGVAFRLNPLDPLPGLVDEAIRRAEPITTAPEEARKTMLWACGVTTVPERLETLLPRTLAGLHTAGFGTARLFVDGSLGGGKWVDDCDGYPGPVTHRREPVRTFPNWWLGLWELFFREPKADRYAMFQDDLICVRGLREYLERCPYPQKGYLNLITYPGNLPAGAGRGWHPALRLGKGAQGLVFSRDAVVALLSSVDMVTRPLSAKGAVPWWANLDGAICLAMKKLGWREYVHSPSLLLHTGTASTIGHPAQPEAVGFPGESFDCGGWQ